MNFHFKFFLEKQKQQSKKILYEILETEKSYVNCLITLDEVMNFFIFFNNNTDFYSTIINS